MKLLGSGVLHVYLDWKASVGTTGFPLRVRWLVVIMINHVEIACNFVLHGSRCCVYLEVMPAHHDYVETFIGSCYYNIFYYLIFCVVRIRKH